MSDNTKEKDALEAYLAESNQFAKSSNDETKKSEKRAWRVAGGATLIAALSIVCIMVMLPLHRVVTEVLVLDKASGLAEPLQTLKEVQLTLAEAFHSQYLNTFILARESYTYLTAEDNYYTAAAFMNPRLQAEWGDIWKADSKTHPMTVYKQDGRVRIDVISIVLKPKDSGRLEVATIRFKKTVERGGFSDPPTTWVATISYSFAEAPKSAKEKRINPIGFQIQHYQVDPELVVPNRQTAPQ